MPNDDGTPEAAAEDAESGDEDGKSQPDGEVPWSDLTDSPTGGVGMPPPSDPPSEVVAATTAFVEPAAYCERCPDYDEAAGACTNPGTAIRQTLPDGRFFVTECPVVTVDGPDFDRVQRD